MKNVFLIFGLSIVLSACAYGPSNYSEWIQYQNTEGGYKYQSRAVPERSASNTFQGGYWSAHQSQEAANTLALNGCSKNYNDCVITHEGSKYVYKTKLEKINEKYSSTNNHVRAEKECKELGFSAESDLSSCKLKLIKSFNQEAAEERKIYYAEEQAKAAQRQAIAAKKEAEAAERRARIAADERSRKMMERGLRSLSGECSLLAGTCK
tara:strand:+ start:2557 stop:3183 length:627 start_codon:yes stop_codon:yes gene_type:complete